MKEFILALFSPLLQLNVVISTLGGFLLGGVLGGMSSSFFGGPSFNFTTALIVGAIAFANSAIISGAGLVINRMRELMEEQVDLTRRSYAAQRAAPTGTSVAAPVTAPVAATTTITPAAPEVQPSPAFEPTEILVCPQCGARQRPDRTACYRCGLPITDPELWREKK